MKSASEVKEFYKGKTVLVTGTTGFVGKVLLNRIIDSCTNVKRIYLMVRPKHNMTLQQRVQDQIFDTECFRPLFRDRPDLIELVK